MTSVVVQHHPPHTAGSPEAVLDAGPRLFDGGPVQEEPHVAAVRLAQDAGDELVPGRSVAFGELPAQLGHGQAEVPEKVRNIDGTVTVVWAGGERLAKQRGPDPA
jgi:hypothetical protein